VSARAPRIRVAGVLTRGPRILLVEHERDGRRYHLLPGGGVEWGETCREALAREFAEELSLRIVPGRLLCINESIAPGGRRHILNLTFQVRRAAGTLKLHPDRRLKQAVWVGRGELRQLTFYPEIRKFLLRSWTKKFTLAPAWIETPWNSGRTARP
jgi:8-oxo-dGTP diphosphatase